MGRRIPRMGTPTPQLAAHKGLRGQILLELKRAQPLTAKDLAEKLRVSPNAIRHHLKELEAEQLIAYGREQRGVRAPRRGRAVPGSLRRRRAVPPDGARRGRRAADAYRARL